MQELYHRMSPEETRIPLCKVRPRHGVRSTTCCATTKMMCKTLAGCHMLISMAMNMTVLHSYTSDSASEAPWLMCCDKLKNMSDSLKAHNQGISCAVAPRSPSNCIVKVEAQLPQEIARRLLRLIEIFKGCRLLVIPTLQFKNKRLVFVHKYLIWHIPDALCHKSYMYVRNCTFFRSIRESKSAKTSWYMLAGELHISTWFALKYAIFAV